MARVEREGSKENKDEKEGEVREGKGEKEINRRAQRQSNKEVQGRDRATGETKRLVMVHKSSSLILVYSFFFFLFLSSSRTPLCT